MIKLSNCFQKTTTRQPDSSSERGPPQIPRESVPVVKEESPKAVEADHSPRNDKPNKEEEAGEWILSTTQ